MHVVNVRICWLENALTRAHAKKTACGGNGKHWWLNVLTGNTQKIHVHGLHGQANGLFRIGRLRECVAWEHMVLWPIHFSGMPLQLFELPQIPVTAQLIQLVNKTVAVVHAASRHCARGALRSSN
jgi:hypothetical protein